MEKCVADGLLNDLLSAACRRSWCDGHLGIMQDGFYECDKCGVKHQATYGHFPFMRCNGHGSISERRAILILFLRYAW